MPCPQFLKAMIKIPFIFAYKPGQHLRYPDGSRVAWVAAYTWHSAAGVTIEERYYIHLN